LKRIRIIIQRQQNVSIIYLLHNLSGGDLLSGMLIFFIILQLRILFLR
jgi:hypothetical protein